MKYFTYIYFIFKPESLFDHYSITLEQNNLIESQLFKHDNRFYLRTPTYTILLNLYQRKRCIEFV